MNSQPALKPSPAIEVIFVTGNAAKVKSFQDSIDAEQAPIRLRHEKLSLLEIQSDDVEAIARFKVQQAQDIFAKRGERVNVMVNDAGFYIPALNNFPGAYSDFAIRKLGAAGYLRLMSHLKTRDERTAYFVNYTVLIRSDGEVFVQQAVAPVFFVEKLGAGTQTSAWQPELGSILSEHPDPESVWKKHVPEYKPMSRAAFLMQSLSGF